MNETLRQEILEEIQPARVKTPADKVFPPEFYDFITGSQLGDGCLCFSGTRAINANYHESGSNTDYILWKKDYLGRWVNTHSRYYDRYDKRTNKTYRIWYYNSEQHIIFTKLRSLWYPNGKKIIPLDELEHLTSFGLAVFYMDDGCIQNYAKNRVLFAVGGFTDEDIEILRKFLYWKWKLVTKFKKYGKTNKKLTLNSENVNRLLELINPHIHWSMKYKTKDV